eukprot:PhM_4_TR3436/c0_g1_i1/m.94225
MWRYRAVAALGFLVFILTMVKWGEIVTSPDTAPPDTISSSPNPTSVASPPSVVATALSEVEASEFEALHLRMQTEYRTAPKRLRSRIFSERLVELFLKKFGDYVRDDWGTATRLSYKNINFLDRPKDLNASTTACAAALSRFVPVAGCPSQHVFPTGKSCNQLWFEFYQCHGLVPRTLFEACTKSRSTQKLAPIQPKLLAYWSARIEANSFGRIIPVLHGGSSARVLQTSAKCYMSVAGLDPRKGGYRIGEVSAGVASVLFFMCPPSRGIECFGVEPVPAGPRIARARFPHLRTYAAWRLGDVLPTSVKLDVVFSVGSIIMLDENEFCAQMGDAMRVLRHGGKLVIISQSTMTIGPWAPNMGRTRVSPKAYRARTPLSFCTDVSPYIKSAEVVVSFPAGCDRAISMTPSDFVTVIVRNDVEMPEACDKQNERGDDVYSRERPVGELMTRRDYDTIARLGIEQWDRLSRVLFTNLDQYARRKLEGHRSVENITSGAGGRV